MNSHNGETLAQLADLLVQEGQSDKAIARAQGYLVGNPGDANAHVVLGSLRMAKKEGDAARTEFERAIQLSPGLTQAYLQLGQLDRDSGEIDAAIDCYEKASALRSEAAPIRTLIGSLYLQKGRP